MENSRLEKIIGFETERGSTYKYQDKKVIRNTDIQIGWKAPHYSDVMMKTHVIMRLLQSRHA